MNIAALLNAVQAAERLAHSPLFDAVQRATEKHAALLRSAEMQTALTRAAEAVTHIEKMAAPTLARQAELELLLERSRVVGPPEPPSFWLMPSPVPTSAYLREMEMQPPAPEARSIVRPEVKRRIGFADYGDE